MDENKKLSRGEFLGLVGGMAMTAVFAKFAGAKQTLAAIGKAERKDTMPLSTYGNNTYGGKRA